MGEPNAEVKLPNEEDGKQQTNKNGKKAEAAGSSSFFTWFVVLALLGVWTSVAVVYFDIVDYHGVIGKLVTYDADGDGDFDVEDAKVLLDEMPRDLSKTGEPPHAKEVGLKLREALKQQLAAIHEKVEARKIAKMALAEVRSILAKEEEEKALDRLREESEIKAWERAEARLREEGEKIERQDVEKAMERIRREKEEREKKAEKMNAQKEEEKEMTDKTEKERKVEKPAGAAEKSEKDGKEKEGKKLKKKQ